MINLIHGSTDYAVTSDDVSRIEQLKNILERDISGRIDVARVVGDIGGTDRRPGVANISFENINGEMLMFRLLRKGIQVSIFSPCGEPRHLISAELKAMDIPFDQAMGTLTFVIGPEITPEDIDHVVGSVCDEVAFLKKISGKR